MKLNQALSGISRMYVDTAPLIYFIEARENYLHKMRALFQEVSHGRLQILTSAVTIPEILMKPLQVNDSALIMRYRTMLYRTQNFQVTSISPSAGDRAAEFRARYNLRTPDALHLACAIESGCEAFLTNDLQISRVREVRIIVLDQLEVT